MLTFDHEQESKFEGATGSRRGDGLVDFGRMMRFRGQINNAMIPTHDNNMFEVDRIALGGQWGATGACLRMGRMEVLEFSEQAEFIRTVFAHLNVHMG